MEFNLNNSSNSDTFYQNEPIHKIYNGTERTDDPFFGRPEYTVLVPTIWCLLVVIGGLGNGLVIYTLGKNGDSSASSCFIVNLAVADLTFLLIVVPSTAASYAYPEWIFGDFVCKLSTYMIYVTLHATSFTLTAMTVDRYYAIVHPLSSITWRNKRITTITCLIVWSVSIIISIPFALYHSTVDSTSHTYCQESWPNKMVGKVVLIAVSATIYFIPLSIIVVCYSRILRRLKQGYRNRRARQHKQGPQDPHNKRKRRITRMIAVIILLFAICWFPIHVLNVYTKIYPEFPKTEVMFVVKLIAHTLSYTNSCANPLIYAFLNDIFQKCFFKTFPCLSYWLFPCVIKNQDDYDNDHVTNMVDQAIQAGVHIDEIESSKLVIQKRNIEDTKLL